MPDVTNFPKQGDDKEVNLRNSNYPQFNYDFALNIKENYPDIWAKGGNIRGNEAFEYWGKARNGDKAEGVLDWIREREAWMARHEGDKLIAGVVAVMKWGGIVTRGEKYMKDLINEQKEGDKALNKIKKVMSCEIKQVGEETDRVLRFVGSDETPDRDDDIIEVTGWKLDEYQKNPVFLWAHNYEMPPIGKAVRVDKDMGGKRLTFDVKFPTLGELSSDIENPSEHAKFVDTVYNLYKGGYLSATSVGFRGLKFKPRDDDKMNSKPEWQRGRRYMEQSLLELSAVPVPSNPNALQQAKTAGIEGVDVVEKHIQTKICEFDEQTNLVKVFDEEGNEKAFTLEFLKSLNEQDMQEYEQWKSGATVSAKNRKLLEAIHNGFDGNTRQLKEFLDAVMPIDPEDMPMTTMPMMEPIMMSAMRTMVADEIKGAFEEFKAQVLSLLPQDASKAEIDLDAIEFPITTKNPADIELNIEPEELKNMIANSIREVIQGGMKQ